MRFAHHDTLPVGKSCCVLLLTFALACSSESQRTGGEAGGGTGGASTGGEAGRGTGGASHVDAAIRDSGGAGTTDAAGRGGGGRSTSEGGDADAASTLNEGGSLGGTTRCKRGMASNIAPGAAFAPSVGWWYNWALAATGADVGIEFVPMIWGEKSASSQLPAGSRFALGFNEPNFFSQAKLTPQQAAALWPSVETVAKARGASIVSPAVNFCGPADQCYGTNPYTYLKDFFDACSGCQVDYIAVHWYNCDLPSLKDYLEPGGSLEGFEQFGRPIWLTEFACAENGDASAAGQEAYMRAAIPYLESNPHVFRYSWFSAKDIPGAVLANSDGSPTPLGQVYIDLAPNCP